MAGQLFREFRTVRMVLTAALLALGVCQFATAASAETATQRFRVHLGAMPVGELTFTLADQGNAYAVRSRFATKGVAGAVAPVHFDLQATGRLDGPHPRPKRYVEEVDTSRRQSHADIKFNGGDSRIDPATGFMIGFADRPLSRGCAASYNIFDGTRTNSLTISEGTWHGDSYICQGNLQRVAGYDASELARSKSFGFTLTFVSEGGKLRASKLVTQSIFGQIILRRK